MLFFGKKKREEAARREAKRLEQERLESEARAAVEREAKKKAEEEAAKRALRENLRQLEEKKRREAEEEAAKAAAEAARKIKEEQLRLETDARYVEYKVALKMLEDGEYDDAEGELVRLGKAGCLLAEETYWKHCRDVAEGKIPGMPLEGDTNEDYYGMASAAAWIMRSNVLKGAVTQYEYDTYISPKKPEDFLRELSAYLAVAYGRGLGEKIDLKERKECIEMAQKNGEKDMDDLKKRSNPFYAGAGPSAERYVPSRYGDIEEDASYEAAELLVGDAKNESDPEKAVRILKRAYELAPLLAGSELAKHYVEGKGIDQDYDEAIKIYEAAYKANPYSEESTMNYASLLYKLGRDPKKAYGVVTDLQGFSGPVTILTAKMMRDGFGTTKDPEGAFNYIRKHMCDFYLFNKPVDDAVDFMTEYYKNKLENGLDPKKLYKWIVEDMFAENSDLTKKPVKIYHGEMTVAALTALLDTPMKEKAEQALYAFYTYGLKDDHWLLLEKLQNDPNNYLIYYHETKARTEAFRLGKKYAESGDPRAMYQTGMRYYHGYGTEKDPAEAQRWLNAAYAGGYDDAKAALEFIKDPGDCKKNEEMFKNANNDHRAKAWAYHLGKGAEFEEGWALKELQLLAREGDPAAQARIAELYYDGPVSLHDIQTAYNFAKKAGEAGCAEGYYICGKICEKANLSYRKYACDYYLFAEEMGHKRAGEKAHELMEANKENFEKGLVAFNEKNYKTAYDLWYQAYMKHDERVVMPSAMMLSKELAYDWDHFGVWIFSEAYKAGETQYAGDVCRACWLDPKSTVEDVIAWGERDTDLSAEEDYIMYRVYELAGRKSDAERMLEKSASGGCYMAQYVLADRYIGMQDRGYLSIAEVYVEFCEKSDRKIDPSRQYGERFVDPKSLREYYDTVDRIVTSDEREEAARRHESFLRYQAESAINGKTQQTSNIAKAVNDIFGSYGLTDQYGNTYKYNPATGVVTSPDGTVFSLSSDEARRRALEHMYNIL